MAGSQAATTGDFATAMLVLVLGVPFLLLVAVAVCTMLLPLHLASAHRAGVSGALGAHARQGTVVRGDALETYVALKATLDLMPNLRVASTDNHQLSLQARRGASVFSWGERIRVDLRQVDPWWAEILVESRAAVRGNWLDGGRNAENVRLVLDAMSAGGPPPS